MTWLNLGSLGGLIALAFLAWAAGGFRRPVPWRTVLTAGGLMLLLGAVVFWIPWTRTVLIWVNDTVITVLRAGNEGAFPVVHQGGHGVLLRRSFSSMGRHASEGRRDLGFVLAVSAWTPAPRPEWT